MKKTLCIILSLLMAGSCLASCSNGEAENNPSVTTPSVENTDNETAETEEETEVETESFDPGLPARDFEGGSFTFLTKSIASYTDWGETSLYSEGFNGEVLNDAVFTRNTYIEDTYNCKLNVLDTGDFNRDVGNAVTAGDTIYDVVMPPLNDAGTLAKKGQLIDLNTVDNINLTQPWWDQRSIADLSIAHKNYMISGDISTLNNDATWCTMINLQVLNNLGVESPYQYVAEDNWNFDTYKKLCADASIDLDGDGDYDSADSIANLTQNENATAMLITFGYHLIDKDENDLPYFSLKDNERVYTILEDISAFMNDTHVSLNYHNYGSEGYHLLTTKMFEENRGLFWITNLQMVIRLREMETDFGIAPCPKYDEAQTNYSNVVWQVGSYTTIPISAANADDSGFILEALAAKSREVLRPAYYETALSLKYLRDEESITMLDLVIDNRAYELEQAFQFGSSSSVESIVLSQQEPASSLQKMEKVINKNIQKTLEGLGVE